MENSTNTHPSMLTLSFGEMRELKYFYSSIIFLCFTMTVLSNCAVIATIAMTRSLQEPMYIFIAVLCINGLFGSVVFIPSLFVNLLSQTQAISYIACITQVFGLHTYIGCEISILGIMAFDRYVCICNPLRYNSIMSLTTVFSLVGTAWVSVVIVFTIQVTLTVRLPLCSSVIQKFYCDNWSVVKLSCIDTTINNIYGLFITILTFGLTPVLILASYLPILKVCLKSSNVFRAKALQTCSPHLIALSFFALDIFTDIIVNRLPPSQIPYELRVYISVQAFVISPFLNSLIYGLKLREIRVKAVQIFCVKRITGLHICIQTL